LFWAACSSSSRRRSAAWWATAVCAGGVGLYYFTLQYNPIPIAKKRRNPAVPFQKALWLLFAGQNEKEDGIIRRLVLGMSPKRSVILSQESGRAEHREWDD